jgi:hypothetical protein
MFVTIIECQFHFLDMLCDNLRVFRLAILNCYASIKIFLYLDESIHTYQSPNCDAYFQIYFWKQVFD